MGKYWSKNINKNGNWITNVEIKISPFGSLSINILVFISNVMFHFVTFYKLYLFILGIRNALFESKYHESSNNFPVLICLSIYLVKKFFELIFVTTKSVDKVFFKGIYNFEV